MQHHQSSSSSSSELLFDEEEEQEQESIAEEEEDDEEVGFFVKVETIIGSGFDIFVYPSDSVDLLKTRIALQEGIAEKDQNLFLSENRTPLNNPNTSLSEIGLGASRRLRLITNISSGLGSKLKRSSSPPSSSSSFFSLPFDLFPPPISPPTQLRRSWVGREMSLPPSTNAARKNNKARIRKHEQSSDEEEEEEMDEELIIFRDREDNRVFVIVRNNNAPQQPLQHPHKVGMSDGKKQQKLQSSSGRMRSTATMTDVGPYGLKRCRGMNGLDTLAAQQQAIHQRQLDRIQENARTLQKMTKIRSSLVAKKSRSINPEHINLPPLLLEDIDRYEEEPSSILTSDRPKSSPSSPSTSTRSVDVTGEECRSHPSSNIFRPNITSTIANLNRLKAEICLEVVLYPFFYQANFEEVGLAKKSGGGSFGILPYTYGQLCKYAQLKIRVLLAEEEPAERNCDFVMGKKKRIPSSAKALTPTVIGRRVEISIGGEEEEKENEVDPAEENQKRPKLKPVASSARMRTSSIHSSARSTPALRRLRSQMSLNIPNLLSSGRIQSRNKSSSSSGRMRLLSAKSGTSTTTQKKTKKDVVRCAECRKKIGVSCRYECRCGKMFCSTHRYAEAHKCTYDYKTEGRKQLKDSNPVVVANKVEKI